MFFFVFKIMYNTVIIMKIIFFGSDEFAAVHLRELFASRDHKVVACVTQPDKAKGRGLEVAPNVVKAAATSAKISVFQPTDLKDPSFIKQMKDFNCDLFVYYSYVANKIQANSWV